MVRLVCLVRLVRFFMLPNTTTISPSVPYDEETWLIYYLIYIVIVRILLLIVIVSLNVILIKRLRVMAERKKMMQRNKNIIVSLKHELFHCFRVLFSSLEMNVHYLENESTLIFDHYTHFSVENGIFPHYSVENGIFPHYSVENGDFSTL